MKIKSFTLTLIILTGALFMSTSCSSNNDYSNYKKPYFSIEFKAQQMGIEIRLNDIPAFKLKNTGFMTLEIQANEYVINGDNEIQVLTYPLYENAKQLDDYIEGSTIEVSFYVREDDEPTEKRKLINKVLITPNNAYLESSQKPVAVFIDDTSKDNSSIAIEKDALTFDYPNYGVFKKQVVTTWKVENLTSSLPHWQWQDGTQIKDNNKTYQSLLNAYKKLYDAFSKKDLSAVKKISEPRSKELAIAYYLKDTEAGFDYSALGKYIDHPSIKLYEKVFTHNVKLEIFGNGKLARIMNGAHTHPILFLDYTTEQTYKDQFMWQKNKNNEWVLIR